jgi:predicted nucleic acid-binding protein
MRRRVKFGGLPLAVVDNTILSRLVALDIAKFLPFLFREILIPPEVKREAYKGPHKGKRRLRKVMNENAGFFVDCREADELTKEYLKADLDEGEAAAIAQADATQSILLLDENKGYRRARTMQVLTIRTGKLLNMLKEAGAIPKVKPYHEKLEETGFYLSNEARLELLAEAGEQ